MLDKSNKVLFSYYSFLSSYVTPNATPLQHTVYNGVRIK